MRAPLSLIAGLMPGGVLAQAPEVRPGDEALAEFLLSTPAGFEYELESALVPGLAWTGIALAFAIAALVAWLLGRTRPPEQGNPWRRLAALLLFVAILAGGGVMLAGGPGEGSDDTRTRSRRGACELGVEFGVRVVGPRRTSVSADVPFAALAGGIAVDSNGHLELLARNVVASPLPGTLGFRFYRGADGQAEFARISVDLADAQALQSFNALRSQGGTAPDAPRADQPPGMDANHTPVNETFRVVATYVPRAAGTDPCKPVTGLLTVSWRWNGRTDQGSSFRPDDALLGSGSPKVPPSRSRVEHSPHVIDETTGFPGKTNKATHTTAFFSVDDPYGCCGRPNTPYAIIQFVRHAWKLGNAPRRTDDWNLDGPESQSERHRQGQPYDPTYTTDPAHGGDPSQSDNGLVQVGPWHGRGGGPAIVVHDFPGLLSEDHDRFVAQGGQIAWEFVTLLVCQQNPASAANYLANATVRAKTHFRILRTYERGKPVPTVEGELVTRGREGAPTFYEPCRPLAEVLDETGLRNAFNNPRPHVVRLQ